MTKIENCPYRIYGRPTSMAGTKLCDKCRELENTVLKNLEMLKKIMSTVSVPGPQSGGPSREERIEKAAKEIERAVNEVLCGEDNVADYDKNIRAILTELVGGKP